jgi:hypothetical protein
MMGNQKSIEVSPGVELDIEEFTAAEKAIFDHDYASVVAMYTKFTADKEGKHVIADAFEDAKDAYFLVAQATKKAILPAAGIFQGQRALTGFGMRMIRPDDLVSSSFSTRTFDYAVSSLTKDAWYGWIHNAAPGAAFNATPLYSRKEMGIGILGVLDVSGAPLIEEIQFELAGKMFPVYNMVAQMRGADLPFFKFPVVEYIKPATQYRIAAKFAATAGNLALIPMGITFVTADFMRQQAPTIPTTSAP